METAVRTGKRVSGASAIAALLKAKLAKKPDRWARAGVLMRQYQRLEHYSPPGSHRTLVARAEKRAQMARIADELRGLLMAEREDLHLRSPQLTEQPTDSKLLSAMPLDHLFRTVERLRMQVRHRAAV